MAIWTVTQELNTAHLTQVFSGGACNILNQHGDLLRNTERDSINNWLTEKNIVFFDPQIHPDTHGEEYDFNKHSVLEIAARKAAKINVYEMSPRTFGGITSLEIAADYYRYNEPTVLFFSDGDTTGDYIPAHSKEGFPLFVPYGIHDNEDASRAHYKEMVKNANNMRKYLMHFARELYNLTISFNNHPGAADIVITAERMHAADIYEALMRAASGQRTIVNFPANETKRDKKGNPLFMAPVDPMEVELHALLDQYVDEGNALRQRIANLIGVNVYLRVVYTHRSAILGLEELLTMKKILSADA